MTSEPEELRELYANRFHNEEAQRLDVWEVLCSRFFQKWVPDDAIVLDIAAGHCEFVNNIKAKRRIAVDLNPDVIHKAGPGVEAIVTRSDELVGIDDGSIDRVFISNFFEHVPREVIASTLLAVRRVLKADGKLLVLQPNVRYCAKDYWMFFDHITPVDDRALVEAFAAAGFDVELNIPRFLPYTTKSRLPSGPGLVKLYLKVPLAWRVLGAQAFMVGRPAAGR
ncbi:class I SAM-dependent methyltransferase [Nocardioides sp. InS609-2]|uniref:class I SAM-dependent methyltransferase n=1 Tax=Nocardioides sp. InS609-2 TaxID=2760705 RepID=UPI0020BF0434|nr:class I SAM-dependent methyltransferase [Nocardioides sp. InS609-2]